MSSATLTAILFTATLTVAATSQQAPNLLPPLGNWSVQVNPAHVVTTVTNGEITLQANGNHVASPITIDVPFTVPHAGTYLLWLDAVWASVPGSSDPWDWSIAGVGAGTWKQFGGTGSRNVAQWIVRLPSGPTTMRLSTTSFGLGNLGRVWPAELRAVDGPQLVPDLCFADPGVAVYASFNILNRQPLTNPVYLLYTSRQTLTTPINWTFGDQWLANPLYLGALNSARFQPNTTPVANALHGLVFRPASAPQWWQVVEYDTVNPLATLRLGSPNRTAAGH
ncbi:MAG: hypothetical protein NXI31_20160 [bacterium]|nr:hypothetical protein [bacterium]